MKGKKRKKENEKRPGGNQKRIEGRKEKKEKTYKVILAKERKYNIA